MVKIDIMAKIFIMVKMVIMHNGPKSLILAPQDIPDISGYQLGFVCPGQHHVKAQVWSFENVREKQK